MNVVVIGAGRMGSLVARKLPANVNKIVVDTDIDKAKSVAVEIGGTGGSDVSVAREADVIILTLPTEIIAPVAAQLAGVVRPDALVLNLATASDTSEALSKAPGLVMVPAKIVGHAREIAAGTRPLVAVDAPSDVVLDLVRDLLRDFGSVVRGPEYLVRITNTIASEEGVKAALAMQERLKAAGVPEEWIIPAIQGPGAGTMRAYAAGDMGPFVRALVERLLQNQHDPQKG